jgi:hypothetical protein
MDFSDLKSMFGQVKTRMDGAIDRVRRDMAAVRTGRATVSLLDGVQVEGGNALDTGTCDDRCAAVRPIVDGGH